METNNFSVKELLLVEQKEINGGFLGILIAGAIIVILNDWDNFKNGLAGKPEVKK